MSKMFKIEVQKKYFIFRLNSTTRSKDTAKVVIATASVKKFEEAVLAAGLTPQKYQEVDILFDKPVKYVDMNKGDNWELMLRNKIVEIDSRT
jgi:saccharopine dehydrogenase-like NADP-dependent oxidoreductase